MTEWDAAGYARRSALQESMAAEVLALLTLRGDERVLDIGCGDGRVTAEIASRVPRGSVVGVDASQDMVTFASQHAQRPNLRFQVANAKSLPFRDEFDLLVSFNALHWLPDPAGPLRCIREALRASGAAQLRLVPDGERKSLEMVLEETRKSPRWQKYFQNFADPYLHVTPEQYAQVAEQCGLRVESVRVAAKRWDFQTRATFFAFGQVTFVEWSRWVPEEEKSAFIDDVLGRYEKVVADAPGEEHTFKFYQMDVRLLRA